ncbi:unnamed protein product [Trichobilharzia regenti]|nr:unnamed protein product [Trichobilharzia regenti]
MLELHSTYLHRIQKVLASAKTLMTRIQRALMVNHFVQQQVELIL